MTLGERIASIYWLKLRGICATVFWDMTWEELTLKGQEWESAKRHRHDCLAFADQILSPLGLSPNMKGISHRGLDKTFQGAIIRANISSIEDRNDWKNIIQSFPLTTQP